MLYSKIFLFFMFSIIISSYDIGELINFEDQNIQFDICHGANEHGHGNGNSPKLSLSEFNGDLNGGDFHVIMIDIAASW